MTDTTRGHECNATSTRLLMALELGRRQWTIGFTPGPGAPVRQRTLRADEWRRLPDEIAAAKQRFGLAADVVVESCYEAGPDGFWIHRYLTQLEVRNRVVDSSSIEVNRRARRAKTDRLDVRKLSAMLARVLHGERDVWHEVRVPSDADEDRRQPQRELRTLKRDRTRVLNRIGGLLATQGVVVKRRADVGHRLEQLRTWRGDPVAAALRARLAREWEKVELLAGQIRAIRQARRAQLRDPQRSADAHLVVVRRLLTLRGIGGAQRLAAGDGVVCLAQLAQSAPSRRPHRIDWHALPERPARSRARDQSRRECADPGHRDRARVVLAAVSTAQCPCPVVRPSVGVRGRARAQDWDCRRRPPLAD